ncbi:MAG: lysophospholipid acyltransferase family protein [Clostridia bacterium]|nr:lysophospholipid acyltransferase family protein [Clostridia bacterium]
MQDNDKTETEKLSFNMKNQNSLVEETFNGANEKCKGKHGQSLFSESVALPKEKCEQKSAPQALNEPLNQQGDGIKKCNVRNPNLKMLKFSRFYYCIAGIIAFFWRIIMRVKIVKSEELKNQKGVYLIVANHASPLDFLSYIGILFPKRQNFVVAENMLYYNKFISRVLIKFGAILKKQFYSDFTCVRGIKKYLDAGIPVLFCPEGKVSDDGITQTIVPSTGKLAKWLGYPVVSVTIRGSSLVRPKWAKTIRRGKIVLDCDVALSKEEVERLSANDINEKIQKSIFNNDHIFQQEREIKFRGKKLAEGLENILYKCPKCGAEFEMIGQKDILRCSVCGNTARYGTDGTISPLGEDSTVFPRIDLWREYVRKSLRDELETNNFFLESKVELFQDVPETRQYAFVEKGLLTMNKEKIIYTPQEKQKEKISFVLLNLPTIVSAPGKSIILYDKNKIYKFMFIDKMMSTKFSMAVEELGKLK